MTEPTAPPPPPTWAQTRALMRSDFRRLLEHMEHASLAKRMFWFIQPNQLGLWLYRLAYHLYTRGWRNTARLVTTFNVYLTRIDIPPTTVIGEGCLIGHFPIVLSGRIGKRFTFWGDGGCGGGFGDADVGAGTGLPVIGDNVVMAVRSMVLGPVRIGDGARIGPGCIVMRDVPAGATVAAPLSRILAPGAGSAAGATAGTTGADQ